MTNTDMQQVLDWAVDEVGIPGIVVDIKDGDRRWFGTAGVADISTGAPRQPGEHAQVGSGGKAFIAAVLLSLEAEGRLSIDDRVNTWLPGVLDVNGYNGNKITIRHLISNTGGLYATGLAPELTNRFATRAAFVEHRFDEFTTEDLFKLTVAQPPVAQPGERFLYANGGFHLAEAIVGKVTGTSFAEEVERRVFQPLGLTNTYVRAAKDTGFRDPHPRSYSKQFFKDGVDTATVTSENWASLLEDPELDPLDVTDFNTSWTPGNIVSTTDDMIRFVSALATGTLLPADQHRQMWTTVSTEGANWLPHTRYGLGLFEFDTAVTDGLVLRGVSGSYWGTMFFTVGTADGEHIISVQTNTEFRTWDVMRRIYEAGFGVSIGE
nr:serine hydrolase domain-containing protein [Kibdelosporangium sp. MJ126-NF4]